MDDVGAGVLDARYNMTGTYSAWLTKVKGGAAMHQGNASLWILDDLSYSLAQRNPVYGVVKFAVFVESDVTPSKSVKHVSNTSQMPRFGMIGMWLWYSTSIRAQVSEHGNRPCQERAPKHVGSPAQQRDTLRLISLHSSSSTLNLRAKRQFHILFASRTDGFKFQAVFSCHAEPVKNSTFTGTRT